MPLLKLAFSTCPNDTFMFDGLVNQRIDTGSLRFSLHLADIEELNESAESAIPDITKISIAAFAGISGKYEFLLSGAAIGFGNGPLVVSKHKIYPDELNDVSIAIPGERTTANLLMSILYPEAKKKQVFLFSDIEEVVLEHEADAGVLIHETRFTYEKKGLRKVCDLGQEWEQHTGLPVPLGGIAIRRSLGQQLKTEINHKLGESIRFAMQNPRVPLDFMKKYAQDMNEEVMYKHVDLYVNEFSVAVGDQGKRSVETLLEKGFEAGILPEAKKPVFLQL